MVSTARKKKKKKKKSRRLREASCIKQPYCSNLDLSFSAYNYSRFDINLSLVFFSPRSGQLRTQKLKSYLVRTQSLNVLPLKPRVGQYIAYTCYAYCQGFFPCLFLPFRSIHLHFPKPLSIFPVLAVANTWFLCRPAE